jgi:acetoacetyl-CoA reductase
MHPIEKLTPQQWRSLIDTNLSSAYFLCRALWPIWKRQGGGVAVNVSSFAARDPFPGLGAYGAAKAGINILGLALSREGAEIGLRVHTVAPAATETAMLRSIISTEQVPVEKTLDPSAVARVIAQCICGDLACTSGEVIFVHK